MTNALKIDDVKTAARGKWLDILQRLGGLTDTQLDFHKNQPCPKCAGNNRFRAFNDVAETGGVFCNKCHSEKNGDGFSTLAWLTGKKFGEVLLDVAEFVGVSKPKPPQKPPLGRLVKAYDYRDENGTLLFQALRYEPKDFRQRRPDGKGGWVFSLKDVRMVLYRLPELVADKASMVFVVEGEKDADTLAAMGLLATSCPMGAGKWRDDFSVILQGRDVTVIADNDEPGALHAAKVCKSLLQHECRVRVCNVPEGKDVSDWVFTGATKGHVLKLSADTPLAELGGDEPEEKPVENATGPRVLSVAETMRMQIESIRSGGSELVTLGVHEIDRAIAGGVALGEVVLICARPSHGKSLLGMQLIHHWSGFGVPSAFMSEEMSALSLGKRALQFASKIHNEDWKENLNQLERDVAEYEKDHTPSFVVESCGSTEIVLQQLQRLVDEKGIKRAIIDYAQLLGGKERNTYDRVTATSKAIKNFAVRNNIVVGLLCQLHRRVEDRKPCIPLNSDIKDSGQLEQDADVILHLAWPHQIDNKNDPSVYTIYVGKNRNREVVSRVVHLRMEPSRQRIRSLPPKPITEYSNYQPGFEAFSSRSEN